MKYNVLITGKDDSMIDDFFSQMTDNFDVVTTSTRFADIINHISFFRPDVFVYCLHSESQDDITLIANLKYRLLHSNIPLVIIGLKEDCDEFEQIAGEPAGLTLRRPLSEAMIRDKIIALVKDRRFMHAVDEISEENAAKARAAAASSEQTVVPTAASVPEQSVVSNTMSVSKQPVAPEAAAVPEQSTALNAVPRTAQQHRKHILVVDDNAMMLKMIKEHLHDQYDVATAASGRVALKFLERKKTDLILLDYEMPEESGPVILEQLRASKTTRDIPVIFLTGVTDTNKIMEALALKPQNYLLKPVDRDKLLDTIAKTIG